MMNPICFDFVTISAGASFQLFLGGQKIFLFFNATGLLKNGKKQHFICSNLTLFIVPFFLFFSFFSLFFLFFFFLGGRRPPSPPQMTPLYFSLFFSFIVTCTATVWQLQINKKDSIQFYSLFIIIIYYYYYLFIFKFKFLK